MLFFFFQGEDGIRDDLVTGVQTCALPICSNPYIEQVKYTPATKKFKVTFSREGKTVEVDPERVPYAREGLPGSILDIATGFHMGLDHACGGVCACAPCHVIVREGPEICNDPTHADLAQLNDPRALPVTSPLA